MGLSILRRALVGIVVMAIVLSALILTVPPVQAATWTQDTEADFSQGTLQGLEIVGSGAPAYLRLIKDGADWKEEAPPSNPGAREGPAIAYDSSNDVIVLFGGYDAMNFNDTWEYSPGTNTWAQVSPPTAPSPRAYAGMTYDSGRNRIVLFGGISDLDFEADTWEYNAAANTWQNTTPPGSPPKMQSYHLTYVQSQGKVLLEGQNLYTSGMETWVYDVATDTWTDRAPSAQPSPRSSDAISYNGDLDRVILFGGFDSSFPPGIILGDTWEYNWASNAWTQTATSGPDARTSSGLSYRSSSGQTYLYGGRSGASFFTDTWRYPDIAGNHQWELVWTQRSPPGRSKFGIADETAGNKSFVYGGLFQDGSRGSDTWSMGPAFRLQGTFKSKVFDSGGANVNWNNISWVATALPPTTVVRFQINASNDPSGPEPRYFYGPGGSSSTYYTSSPSPIWTGHDNQRYLVVFAQVYTLDDLVSPTLDSVTINYDVPSANPYLIFTDPQHNEPLVPTDSSITVRFSESMIPSSVDYTIDPPLTTTRDWSESNSKLTLNHTTPMLQCTLYTVTITQGTDLAGNSLTGGPIQNPWTFTTICIPPEITATDPYYGKVDVPENAAIVIDFSEAMDTATVSPNISPVISLTPTWSNGDTRVTYNHVANFTQCLEYTVNVTGKDTTGYDLISGSVPNPFTFRVVCTTPYIVSTTPIILQIDVSLSQDIIVIFSEPMNKAAVVPTITPTISLTPAWSNGNKTVTYTHPAFTTCTAYEVSMTGKDVDGNDLWHGRFDGFADNPWKFATVCASPFIIFTLPPDGATDVDRQADIVVAFSKAMNNATVTWDIQPAIQLYSSWDSLNTVLMLNHTDAFVCGVNQVTVTGRDASGNSLIEVLAPNPWTFTPLCPNPFIVSTDPTNNSFGVPVAKEIVVTFSEPMDTFTVVHSLTPADVSLTQSWSVNNTVLTLKHTAPFTPSQLYRVFVDGADMEGYGLLHAAIPNPWWFTTEGASPYIVDTNPQYGEMGVPLSHSIIINFSEPMNISTVSCPANPSIALSAYWSNGDTTLTLTHTALFPPMTEITVTCSGKDLDGNDLVPGPVPNPWHFRTVGIIPPEIISTVPSSGAGSVPLDQNIIVTFNEPMDTATVTCVVIPSGITFNATWPGGPSELILTHLAQFAPLTMYTVTCSGKDVDGNDLVPGPVPNPWSFTTTGELRPEAPGGLQITRVPPTIVRLTWRAVAGADLYRIYESTNRFATFPWAPLGTTTATTFDASHLADGLTHYYIVRTEKAGLESANSTMAVKIDKSIGYSPTGANIHWFSLPYQSPYVRASDISTELTSAKISVVAKWNPAAQKPTLWYYFRNKWRGTDFTIGPGDGLYVGSVSAFQWVIVGTDANVILSFTYNTPPRKNVNWISVPYTGNYTMASDIADELTSSKVIEIGFWNPLTQMIARWYWTGLIWTGDNFAINPGDGVYMTIASDFTWQPGLVTPEVA